MANLSKIFLCGPRHDRKQVLNRRVREKCRASSSIIEDYAPGRHSAAPEGHVVLPARNELLLLHYQYLGFEHVRKRYAQILSSILKRYQKALIHILALAARTGVEPSLGNSCEGTPRGGSSAFV